MPGQLVVRWKEPATFGLGQATPNAVRFAHAQREVEALALDRAVEADAFRTRFTRLPFFASLRERRRKEELRLWPAARSL